MCDRCGDPLATWRPDTHASCPRCRRIGSQVDRTGCIGHYAGSLRLIVHAFKYDGRRSLAAPLAALMRERGWDVLHGADAVVPVPLHVSKRWRRGFNQSMDLARRLGVPVSAALRRRRRTATQSALPAARRHGNVRGAFAATRAAARLAGRTAVLVDDVVTTGATIEACARELKEAGVREVRALTVARAPAGRQ